MLGYIVRRILASIPVVFIVALFTFTLLYLMPGDPAVVMAGMDASPNDIERIRARLGLNDPFHERLGQWLGSVARGNLGESVFSKYKVTDMMKDRIEPTLSLAILSTLFSVGVALPLGVLAAWKANTWIDRAVMLISSVGIAMPSFFLGFVLMWGIAIKGGVLPVLGYTPPGEGFLEYIRHLILPSITVGLGFMALIARMTRASMMEVLQEDYIRTARAKGLGERLVLSRHALRNAALPVLTVIGLGVAILIAGLVVVEKVFAIPGMGSLVVDAITRRDYPVIQGMILLVAAIYIVVNLFVDVMYAYLDPRIRY